jgi:endo-1,4-beta-xylanase
MRGAFLALWALACTPTARDSAPPGDTGPLHPCLEPGATCSLGEIAAARGLWAGAAIPNDPSAERQEAAAAHFRSATAENAMKWGALCPSLGACDYSQADLIVDWAEQQGLRLRGHTLVWGQHPGHGHPGDLAELTAAAEDPYAFMEQAIAEHIATTVGRYRGRVESWDVVNEPLAPLGSTLDESVFHEAMGADYLDHALRSAHEADPDARLFVNEYVIADYAGDKAQAFVALLEELLARGAPLHGAGVQAHVFVEVPDPEKLGGLVRDLAALGLDVELTELDVAKLALLEQLEDDQALWDAQAEAYSILVGACQAEPRCTGFTTWGIDDPDTWLDSTSPYDAMAPNEPLLLDASFQPKPAYDTLRALLQEAP